MLNIGLPEILVILVIALLVVGPQRLPDLARSIGKGLREVRRAQDEVKRTIQLNLDEETPNGGQRPTGRAGRPTTASPGGSTPADAGSEPGSASAPQDPTPLASEPMTTNEVREISRTLGRGLAEIRRAREEVQRSFRVDLNRPAPRPARSAPPRPSSPLSEPTADTPTTSDDQPATGEQAGDAEAPDGRPAGST